MRRTLSLLCITAITAALLCSACRDKIKPGNVEPKRKEVSGVVIKTVTPSMVDAFYETSGTVKAKNVSTLSSRLMGTVKKINVKEGDRVNKDDVLLIIDDSDVSQKMAAAEAGYKEAQRMLEVSQSNRSLAEITHKRYKKLHEEKVISQQEYDQVETRAKVAGSEYERARQSVERAKAMQEEARAYYGFARIKAPYSGLVTAKKIDEGTMAVAGMPLLVVEDTSRFKIEVPVDERLYKRLSVGMGIPVLIAATDGVRQGNISRIAPAVDPSTRTFAVEILLKGDSLRTGNFARVLIPDGKKEAILVPKGAVVEKGQLTGVYTVNDKGVVSYSLVKTGRSRGEQSEVLSGLKKGDRIIVEGAEKAVDGGLVRQ